MLAPSVGRSANTALDRPPAGRYDTPASDKRNLQNTYWSVMLTKQLKSLARTAGGGNGNRQNSENWPLTALRKADMIRGHSQMGPFQ